MNWKGKPQFLFKCPRCGRTKTATHRPKCPKCGAKMVHAG